MNEEKKEKIWEEILKVVKEEKDDDILPDEKTFPELMDMFHLRRDGTQTRVDKLVKSGILLKRRGRYRKWLYRPNPDLDVGFSIDSTKPQEE